MLCIWHVSTTLYADQAVGVSIIWIFEQTWCQWQDRTCNLTERLACPGGGRWRCGDPRLFNYRLSQFEHLKSIFKHSSIPSKPLCSLSKCPLPLTDLHLQQQHHLNLDQRTGPSKWTKQSEASQSLPKDVSCLFHVYLQPKLLFILSLEPVHDRLVQERRVHIDGRNERNVLLQQRLLLLGWHRIWIVCKWIWSLLSL